MQRPSEDINDYSRVECRRCGNYQVSGSFRETLRTWSHNVDRTKLIIGVRCAFERVKLNGGNVTVTTTNVRDFIAPITFLANPLEAADALLIWIRDHLESFSGSVSLSPAFDFPVLSLQSEQEFVLAVQLRWVRAGTGGGQYAQYYMEPEGWRQLNALRDSRAGSRQAFVAMRFSAQMFSIYREAIKPAIYEMGFEPFIVRDSGNNNPIDDEIIAGLKRSAFVVADFTDMRTAVFFEAGVGVGMGVPVIWCVKEEQFGTMGEHFDTRQYPYVIWANAIDLKKQLKDRIGATIPGARERPSSPEA